MKLLPKGTFLSDGITKLVPKGTIVPEGQGLQKLLPSGRPVVEQFFISGTLYDVAGGANLGFAADDTNTINYRQDAVCTDPSNSNIVYVLWYRASDGQLCVAKSTTGATGAYTTTVATATLIVITDEHRTISACVDKTGRLNVQWGMHGAAMNYWRAPNAGDTLVTNATKISPVVAANAGIEAATTYPIDATFPDGDNAFLWRTGGSGNGDTILYLISGTTITTLTVPFLSGFVPPSSSCSFYPNTLIIEGSDSKHPGRLWFSFQARDTTDPLTAHGLYCLYTDDKGLTIQSWDGTTLPTSAALANLGPALVAAIPVGTPNYFGFQGMCVGLDGVPTITMYYGTTDVDFYLRAWRLVNGAWVQKNISSLFHTGVQTGLSRLKPIWKDNKLICFYAKALASDGSIGRLCYSITYGDQMRGLQEGTVFVRNGINKIGDASPLYDSVDWRSKMATPGVGPQFYWQDSGPTTNPGANGPALLQTLFTTVQPTLLAPPEIYGAGALDWFYEATAVVNDGSGNALTLVDGSGNGRDITQASSGARAAILAASLNGNATLRFNGSSSFYNLILSNVSPTVPVPYFVEILLVQRGWTSGRRLLDLNGALLFQTGSTPGLRQNHGTSSNANSSATIGAWKRIRLYFTGSVADYILIGAAGFQTGISSGNTITGTNVTIGATGGGGSLFSQYDLAYAYAYRGAPTAQQLYNSNGYCIAKWGGIG